MDIINTPINEREMKVFAMNFERKGTNEFGRDYERNLGNDIIELFDSGIVRYLTKDKNAYLRVFNESKENDFKFDGDVTNDEGEKFSTYKKDNYSISLGYFTRTKKYLFAIQDDSKIIVVPDFLPASFLVGSWGRVSILHGGKYTFFENNTFSFEDSREGKITGKWKIEKKEIVLNYDKKIGEYGINHGLSIATEIIHVTNKQSNTIDGYLDNNQLLTITLSRQ